MAGPVRRTRMKKIPLSEVKDDLSHFLREAAKQDFPGVLKAVADAGYRGVEMAGLQGHNPKEIARIVSDLGMVVSSSHTALPTRENVAEIADTELALGNRFAISGMGRDAFDNLDAVKSAAEKFNRASELLHPYGISFGIHNHWWEFAEIDGRHVYDILMEQSPAIFGELDVYWVAYGHADPVEVICLHKSRLPFLHIKDGMLREGDMNHTAVGSGVLNMPEIISEADPNVLKWLVVELDNCECDMLEAVRQSYDYLTSQDLAVGSR